MITCALLIPDTDRDIALWITIIIIPSSSHSLIISEVLCWTIILNFEMHSVFVIPMWISSYEHDLESWSHVHYLHLIQIEILCYGYNDDNHQNLRTFKWFRSSVVLISALLYCMAAYQQRENNHMEYIYCLALWTAIIYSVHFCTTQWGIYWMEFDRERKWILPKL